uniref:Uncharacterized protein n=1 Tax=Phaeomonas parva TaxID=124430 RepID=A0A7S1XQ93_9STRA|mmetsp:Transcript_23918/g.75347  ORF Transcript_23918/g.75347 Transcript_23918/m.75347 type:complete len:1744 (+) Transcript_23918:185-5416(+)
MASPEEMASPLPAVPAAADSAEPTPKSAMTPNDSLMDYSVEDDGEDESRLRGSLEDWGTVSMSNQSGFGGFGGSEGAGLDQTLKLDFGKLREEPDEEDAEEAQEEPVADQEGEGGAAAPLPLPRRPSLGSISPVAKDMAARVIQRAMSRELQRRSWQTERQSSLDFEEEIVHDAAAALLQRSWRRLHSRELLDQADLDDVALAAAERAVEAGMKAAGAALAQAAQLDKSFAAEEEGMTRKSSVTEMDVKRFAAEVVQDFWRQFGFRSAASKERLVESRRQSIARRRSSGTFGDDDDPFVMAARDGAARTIQDAARRYLDRAYNIVAEQLDDMLAEAAFVPDATSSFEASLRSFGDEEAASTSPPLEQLAREVAAARLQALWRGFVDRTNLDDVLCEDLAAYHLERLAEDALRQVEMAQQEQFAAEKLQCAFRQKLARLRVVGKRVEQRLRAYCEHHLRRRAADAFAVWKASAFAPEAAKPKPQRPQSTRRARETVPPPRPEPQEYAKVDENLDPEEDTSSLDAGVKDQLMTQFRAVAAPLVGAPPQKSEAADSVLAQALRRARERVLRMLFFRPTELAAVVDALGMGYLNPGVDLFNRAEPPNVAVALPPAPEKTNGVYYDKSPSAVFEDAELFRHISSVLRDTVQKHALCTLRSKKTPGAEAATAEGRAAARHLLHLATGPPSAAHFLYRNPDPRAWGKAEATDFLRLMQAPLDNLAAFVTDGRTLLQLSADGTARGKRGSLRGELDRLQPKDELARRLGRKGTLLQARVRYWIAVAQQLASHAAEQDRILGESLRTNLRPDIPADATAPLAPQVEPVAAAMAVPPKPATKPAAQLRAQTAPIAPKHKPSPRAPASDKARQKETTKLKVMIPGERKEKERSRARKRPRAAGAKRRPSTSRRRKPAGARRRSRDGAAEVEDSKVLGPAAPAESPRREPTPPPAALFQTDEDLKMHLMDVLRESVKALSEERALRASAAQAPLGQTAAALGASNVQSGQRFWVAPPDEFVGILSSTHRAYLAEAHPSVGGVAALARKIGGQLVRVAEPADVRNGCVSVVLEDAGTGDDGRYKVPLRAAYFVGQLDEAPDGGGGGHLDWTLQHGWLRPEDLEVGARAMVAPGLFLYSCAKALGWFGTNPADAELAPSAEAFNAMGGQEVEVVRGLETTAAAEDGVPRFQASVGVQTRDGRCEVVPAVALHTLLPPPPPLEPAYSRYSDENGYREALYNTLDRQSRTAPAASRSGGLGATTPSRLEHGADALDSADPPVHFALNITKTKKPQRERYGPWDFPDEPDVAVPLEEILMMDTDDAIAQPPQQRPRPATTSRVPKARPKTRDGPLRLGDNPHPKFIARGVNIPVAGVPPAKPLSPRAAPVPPAAQKPEVAKQGRPVKIRGLSGSGMFPESQRPKSRAQTARGAKPPYGLGGKPDARPKSHGNKAPPVRLDAEPQPYTWASREQRAEARRSAELARRAQNDARLARERADVASAAESKAQEAAKSAAEAAERALSRAAVAAEILNRNGIEDYDEDGAAAGAAEGPEGDATDLMGLDDLLTDDRGTQAAFSPGDNLDMEAERQLRQRMRGIRRKMKARQHELQKMLKASKQLLSGDLDADAPARRNGGRVKKPARPWRPAAKASKNIWGEDDAEFDRRLRNAEPGSGPDLLFGDVLESPSPGRDGKLEFGEERRRELFAEAERRPRPRTGAARPQSAAGGRKTVEHKKAQWADRLRNLVLEGSEASVASVTS